MRQKLMCYDRDKTITAVHCEATAVPSTGKILCVHPALVNLKPVGEFWHLTHVPSGFRIPIGNDLTKEEALRIGRGIWAAIPCRDRKKLALDRIPTWVRILHAAWDKYQQKKGNA